MLWWVGRLPGLSHRVLVRCMALGLVCSNATFAMWISVGGGGLTLYLDNRLGLLGMLSNLARASLTQPEGQLFAACCFGWFVMHGRIVTSR